MAYGQCARNPIGCNFRYSHHRIAHVGHHYRRGREKITLGYTDARSGGLSLGIAIQQSGLADFFVSKISNYEFYDVVFLIIFAFATVIFSNIMSNTATATILIPVATILPGVNPIEAAVVIGLSASFALFLPVSTPPNAIAFSTGYLKQSDFKLGGFWIGLLGPVLTILWVLLLSYFGFMS